MKQMFVKLVFLNLFAILIFSCDSEKAPADNGGDDVGGGQPEVIASFDFGYEGYDYIRKEDSEPDPSTAKRLIIKNQTTVPAKYNFKIVSAVDVFEVNAHAVDELTTSCFISEDRLPVTRGVTKELLPNGECKFFINIPKPNVDGVPTAGKQDAVLVVDTEANDTIAQFKLLVEYVDSIQGIGEGGRTYKFEDTAVNNTSTQFVTYVSDNNPANLPEIYTISYDENFKKHFDVSNKSDCNITINTVDLPKDKKCNIFFVFKPKTEATTDNPHTGIVTITTNEDTDTLTLQGLSTSIAAGD